MFFVHLGKQTLSLLFSGAVVHVVTYLPFCLDCVLLLDLLTLLTGADATAK